MRSPAPFSRSPYAAHSTACNEIGIALKARATWLACQHHKRRLMGFFSKLVCNIDSQDAVWEIDPG